MIDIIYRHLQTVCTICVLPVLCPPLISSMRGWTYMEKWVVCWASWGPQWWWFMPPRRRRLLPSVSWLRSSETQVGAALSWSEDIHSVWKHLAGFTIVELSHQVSLCSLCAFWGAACFWSLLWLRGLDRRMCWSTSSSALLLAPSLCPVWRAWVLASKSFLLARLFWRTHFSGR